MSSGVELLLHTSSSSLLITRLVVTHDTSCDPSWGSYIDFGRCRAPFMGLFSCPKVGHTAEVVKIPLHQLTDRQLTIHLVDLLGRQVETLERLDSFMADLSQSVADLQAAVDNIATRFAAQLTPLQEALSQAQQQVSQLQSEDQEQVAQLNQLLSDASAAADAIQSEVSELNSIGANPETPVEETPSE